MWKSSIISGMYPIVSHSEVLQNRRNTANSNWIENNDFLSNRFLIANWYNSMMSQVITAMHRWCQIERLSDWKCWHGRLKIHPRNIFISVCVSHVSPPIQTIRFRSCVAFSLVFSQPMLNLKPFFFFFSLVGVGCGVEGGQEESRPCV